ncbi:MAG: hypothetical protein CL993_01175 [Euryarchaeota archaeon]|nr:hypothetical protein [Euryarchaeota archaeon]
MRMAPIKNKEMNRTKNETSSILTEYPNISKTILHNGPLIGKNKNIIISPTLCLIFIILRLNGSF